jgi:hypothetical protein
MKLESMNLLFGDVKNNGGPRPKNINTNIAITSATVSKNNLTVDFEHTASHDPDGSHIRVGGRALFIGPEAKKAYDEWSKKGRITGAHGELIMNAINYSASINGVLIAKAFNLTAPVVLAKLTYADK